MFFDNDRGLSLNAVKIPQTRNRQRIAHRLGRRPQKKEILSGDKSEKSKEIRSYRLIIKPWVYNRYLKDVPKKEVGGIVEKAPEMYFKDMSACSYRLHR